MVFEQRIQDRRRPDDAGQDVRMGQNVDHPRAASDRASPVGALAIVTANSGAPGRLGNIEREKGDYCSVDRGLRDVKQELECRGYGVCMPYARVRKRS